MNSEIMCESAVLPHLSPRSYQHDETSYRTPTTNSLYKELSKWKISLLTLCFAGLAVSTLYVRPHLVDTGSLRISIKSGDTKLTGSKLANHMISNYLAKVSPRSNGHQALLGKSATETNDLPVGCHATTVIVRHCEKGDIREHCSALGFQRADYLASLFGNDDTYRWPAPSFIFALSPGDRNNENVHNYREVETVTPLSKKIGVSIDDSFGLDQSQDLAERILGMLTDGQLCNKVALVAWKHSEIPHLSNLLGCAEEHGCPTTWSLYDYDNTVQIIYSYHKQKYPSFVSEEKKNKNRMFGEDPQWWINGHIQPQNFDPLEYAKRSGVY